MTTSAQQFGTFVPAEQLPRKTFEVPFESEDSLAYLYCNQCGLVSELNREKLEITLRMINLALDSAHAVDEVEWKQHYILAHGCPQCSEGITPLSLEKISD